MAADLTIAQDESFRTNLIRGGGGLGTRMAPPARIGLDRVVPEIALAQLRSATVGRLVSVSTRTFVGILKVRATVTRVGAIRPLVRSACFSCIKCGSGADDDSLRAR